MSRGQSLWIAVFLVVLGWSAFRPFSYGIWFLEVFPALIAAAALWLTRDRFPLTRMVYVLILVHCIILMVGAHYTYAQVPLGEWVQHAFEQDRNNYDKLGHFAQGFVPAIVAREVVIRLQVFNSVAWRNFFIACFCLAAAAVYEFVEWWVAVGTGDAADDFLGTQGDVWDTQWDMFLCLCGAILSQIFLARLHDRFLARLGETRPG